AELPQAEAEAEAEAEDNVGLREATEAFQRQTISRALQRSGNNWAAAARALAMDVANLHRLARRLGLKD
ncbi:TPA: nitric oxide reductase transcription regulator, partial [Pluralibacter gergoviae]|nr:nitric oxide reductase transcription regulator [Pluralibacter gergoviae]